MAKFVSITSAALPNPEEDFRSAARVEQYRISEAALYVPEGFHWKYIPLSAVEKAEESFRVISAGHCVPVREIDAGVFGRKLVQMQSFSDPVIVLFDQRKKIPQFYTLHSQLSISQLRMQLPSPPRRQGRVLSRS